MFDKENSLSVTGENNISALGNIIFAHHNNNDRYKLSDTITQEFNKLDAIVSNKIGKLRPSKYSAEVKVDYSSQKLYESLSILAIPAGISFDIVMKTPAAIISEVDNIQDDFSTSHIRRIVSRLILHIDVPIEMESERQEWASRYARKYGNPDQVIQVLNADGSEGSLTYNFLVKTMIPKVIQRILYGSSSVVQESNYRQLVNQRNIREMAEIVIENIRRLDLYNIRFKTLLYLIEDLALQPPHPWFVSQETTAKTTLYDLERADAHLLYCKESLTNIEGIQNIFWTHVGESIHHSCSSILAFYGMFLGSNYLSPLSALKNTLSIIYREENLALWSFCKINKLAEDIKEIGKTEAELRSKLDSVSIYLAKKDAETASNCVNIAEFLNYTAHGLIHCREIYEQLVNRRTSLDIDISDARKVLLTAITKSDCLWVSKESREGIIVRTSVAKCPKIANLFGTLPVFIDINFTSADIILSELRNIRHSKLTATCIIVGVDAAIEPDVLSAIRNESIEKIYHMTNDKYIEFLNSDKKSIFLEQFAEGKIY